MLKKFTLIALSCFVIIFTNSCTSEVGSLEAGPVASYSFNASPSPIVEGIYVVNKLMYTNNTVTLSINVTVRGKYYITTNSMNGVVFELAGVFATTGPQTIVLYGKGIPLKPGSFTYVTTTGNSPSFSVTFLATEPPAVFTYAGGSGACAAPSINGMYASGVATGPGNYVDLAVNVTSIGAYTVSTNSASGIAFIANGSFLATGPQVIHLVANGTPSTTGTFSFTPTGGCSFSINVLPPPPPAVFTYTCLPAATSGTFAAGTALTSASTVKIGVVVTTAGLYSITTDAQNGVTFSASGIIAAGPQVITLTSTNTPAAAGTFSYTPAGASCTFDVTYTSGGGGGGGGGGGTPTMFLKCTVGGVATNFNTGLLAIGDIASGTFNVSGSNSDGGSDDIRIIISDNSNPLAAGDYNNFTFSSTTKGCQFLYNTSAFVTGINANSFVVHLTTITANSASGTFSGTIYNNFGAGPGTKSISAGSFSVTY